nr:immunoglobulin light chain junction region [Macaca mulatta]MOX53259.1 immunoglobulin light chain junction region [Macaca mulatta]MOX54910.1 immunoglobulin light chain junction region [Macaca mulatta]MOX56201.1 immunoglobulin light chain junction region [Macaca mulatta]MOX57052.1 immunoglobulin light chain junction region [Macaca mulatta]
CQQCHSTPYSF